MALAHNGNLSNALELRDKLELSGAIFHTTSDTETIAYVITRERLMTPSIEEAVSNAMNLLEGAYSLVLLSETKMIAAKGSVRIQTALLRPDAGRGICGGIRKLCPLGSRRRICP